MQKGNDTTTVITLAPLDLSGLFLEADRLLQDCFTRGVNEINPTLLRQLTFTVINNNHKSHKAFDSRDVKRWNKSVGGHFTDASSEALQKLIHTMKKHITPIAQNHCVSTLGALSIPELTDHSLDASFGALATYTPDDSKSSKNLQNILTSLYAEYSFDRDALHDAYIEYFYDEEDDDDDAFEEQLKHEIENTDFASYLTYQLQLYILEQYKVLAQNSDACSNEERNLLHTYVTRIKEFTSKIPKDRNTFSSQCYDCLPVIPLIQASQIVALDCDSRFQCTFNIVNKLNGAFAQSDRSSVETCREHFLAVAEGSGESLTTDQKWKAAFQLMYYIDHGTFPALDSGDTRLCTLMREYTPTFDYNRLAQCIAQLIPHATMTADYYLNLDVYEDKRLTGSAYHGQEADIFQYANIGEKQSSDVAVPIRFTFGATRYRSGGTSVNGCGLTAANDSCYIAMVLGSQDAIKVARAQQLTKADDDHAICISRPTSQAQTWTVMDDMCYDILFSVLVAIYLRLKCGVGTSHVHLMLQKFFRTALGEASAFQTTFGSDTFLAALGYGLEQSIGNEMLTVSSQGITGSRPERYKLQNAASSIAMKAGSRVVYRGRPEQWDVRISHKIQSDQYAALYVTSYISDKNGYKETQKYVRSCEGFVFAQEKIRYAGTANDILEGTKNEAGFSRLHTIRESDQLKRLIQRLYDSGIRNFLFIADVPFSISTTQKQEGTFYLDKQNIEFLESLESLSGIRFFPLFLSKYQTLRNARQEALIIGNQEKVFHGTSGRYPVASMLLGLPFRAGKTIYRSGGFYQTLRGYYKANSNTNRWIEAFFQNGSTRTEILYLLALLHLKADERSRSTAKNLAFSRIKDKIMPKSVVSYNLGPDNAPEIKKVNYLALLAWVCNILDIDRGSETKEDL